MRRCTRLLAVLVAAGVLYGAETGAQSRTSSPLLQLVGPDEAGIVLGTSAPRACYEAALFGYSGREAIAECDAALEGQMSRTEIAATYVNRGILHGAAGNYRSALADYLEALRLVPDLGEAHLNAGLAYLRLGQPREAIEAIDRGIVLAPKTVYRGYFNRARARESLGDLKGAYADYQKAAELAPNWYAPRRELERFSAKSADS